MDFLNNAIGIMMELVDAMDALTGKGLEPGAPRKASLLTVMLETPTIMDLVTRLKFWRQCTTIQRFHKYFQLLNCSMARFP